MKCPGQDTQYWNQDAIFEVDCPQCGAAVEFYRDDTARTCRNCSHRFVNPKMDFGCAAYCPFAEQCIGTLPEDVGALRDNLLKDKVAVAMKRLHHHDFKRIGRMVRQARYAEKIGLIEQANPAVVLCAAYLDQKGARAPSVDTISHGSEERDLTDEIVAHARTLLGGLGAHETMIDAVCSLLDRAPADDVCDSPESRTLADARLLVAVEELFENGQATADESIRQLKSKLSCSGGHAVAKTLFPQFDDR